jgi:hypothetical protein
LRTVSIAITSPHKNAVNTFKLALCLHQRKPLKVSFHPIAARGRLSVIYVGLPGGYLDNHPANPATIRSLKAAVNEPTLVQPPNLLPFILNPRELMPDGLPFKFEDYLESVDWSGRIVR